MKKIAAIGLLAAIAVAPAHAQQGQQAPHDVTSSGGFLIARGLYTSCVALDPGEQLACRTYIMGVMDSMAMHVDNRWAQPVLCNAGSLDASQLGSIYADYIRRNPDKADWTAASTVYNALAERYPCRRAN